MVIVTPGGNLAGIRMFIHMLNKVRSCEPRLKLCHLFFIYFFLLCERVANARVCLSLTLTISMIFKNFLKMPCQFMGFSKTRASNHILPQHPHLSFALCLPRRWMGNQAGRVGATAGPLNSVYSAAINGNIAKLEEALRTGASLDERNNHVCVRCGNVFVFMPLKRCVLLFAVWICKYENDAWLMTHLYNLANVMQSPLHWACRNHGSGHVDFARTIIEMGANINLPSTQVNSLLFKMSHRHCHPHRHWHRHRHRHHRH